MKDPFFQRESEKYEVPIASRELILSYLEQSKTPANLEQIAEALQVDETLISGLHRRLRAMERDGQVIFTRRKCYALPDKLQMIKGFVIAHRDGFGFLRVEGQTEDYFLAPNQMQSVLQGDFVLAQPIGSQYKGKTEARIVRILQERSPFIVGRYFLEQNVGFVVPDDQRLNFDILIPEFDKTVRMGNIVVVELQQRPQRRQKAVGKITEILGEALETKVAIEMAIRNHDIPSVFSEKVNAFSQKFTEIVQESEKQNRLDLRHLPFVTIDGEDARDFDDAVYCEKRRGGGYRLWVAIADVSYYVRPNDPIDQAAQTRGTSVYFPSRVIPMLPEVLSNGLCSLNPNVDRLALACEMILTANGKMTSYRFHEAVIYSHARLTYTKTQKILDGDQALSEQYQARVKDLFNLYDLYKVLDHVKQERGAISFETPEPKFIFNADKRIERIEEMHRNDAHKIIEECMIQANIAAAEFVGKNQLPLLYRVHAKPDEAKMQALKSTLAELGLSLNLKQNQVPEPKDIALLMTQIADRPDHEMLQTLILRSMKQAIYDPQNLGHFGLALDNYAHFTSPIRRYPDLTLHREIKFLLEKTKKQLNNTGSHSYTEKEMVYLGEHCSLTERRADEAVRDVMDWLKCDFMQDHLNETFEGVISSVTNFGFFVRLNDLFIDGLVHVSSLDNDYYHFDPLKNRLIGEHTGTSYWLGDKVTVKVIAVNVDDRKIDLNLLSIEKKGKTKTFFNAIDRSKEKDKKKAKSSSKKADSTFAKDTKKKVKTKEKNKGKSKEKDKSKSKDKPKKSTSNAQKDK